jgi:hypothetical protein
MKKYNKAVKIDYRFVESQEPYKVLEEVFDDIFMRLSRKEDKKIYDDFSPNTAYIVGKVLKYRSLHIDI